MLRLSQNETESECLSGDLEKHAMVKTPVGHARDSCNRTLRMVA